MDELIREYINYIAHLEEIKRPEMPNFNLSAYTESEYVDTIKELMDAYDLVDDFELTVQFIKGEN